MLPRSARVIRFVTLALILALPAIWLLRHLASAPPAATPPPETVAPAPADHAFTPSSPPALLTTRAATTAEPPLSRERLLAADGTPAEDLAALSDLVTGYLQSGLGDTRRAIGFNEDLVLALTERAALGDAALPAEHPAIRDGRLLDRWGTPWQVHPLAGDLIQLRSAGPDRRLYTADDLVAPGSPSP